MTAKQKLALKAAKKGVNMSIGAIKRHLKKAGEISSETVGDRAQKILEIVTDEIEEWHLAGIEDHVIQKFAAMILKKLKDLNILVAVDHIVFQRVQNFIHPVDMDIVKKDGKDLTRPQVVERSENLLKSVLDPELETNLETTMKGGAWRILQQGESQNQNGN